VIELWCLCLDSHCLWLFMCGYSGQQCCVKDQRMSLLFWNRRLPFLGRSRVKHTHTQHYAHRKQSSQWRNWRGSERQMPPWQLSRGALFGFLCFLNDFINFKPLVYINFCIAKILSEILSWNESKRYSCYSFFLKKEWPTECQWKVTALTVDPSLVAETLFEEVFGGTEL